MIRAYTRRHEGFTIIEILVVLVVIGILFSIGTVSFVTMQNSAADTEVQGDLRQAAGKIERYRSEMGGYPATQNLVDGGKGLPKSASDRVYEYKSTSSMTYCLSSYVKRTKTTFKIQSGSSEIIKGTCS